MKSLKIALGASLLSLSMFGTSTAHALTPSPATLKRCEANWGADNNLAVQCANLYDKCRTGKLKHKGCKAFVRGWNAIANEYQ